MYGMALSNMVLLERAVLAHYPAGRNINDLGIINEGKPLMMPCEKTKYYPKPTFSWAIVNGLDDPTETPVVLDKRIQMDDSGKQNLLCVRFFITFFKILFPMKT